MANWTETKKELEVNERGDFIVTRVTLELQKKKYAGLEKKELVDLSLRLIGLLAIFIPLWLFFRSQKAENQRQRAIFQLDTYTKLSKNLHLATDRDAIQPVADSIQGNLFYDIYPKVLLLGDKEIIDTFKVIKDAMLFYAMVWQLRDLNAIDSELIPKFIVENPASQPLAIIEKKLQLSGPLANRYLDWKDHKIKTFMDSFIPAADKDIGMLRLFNDYAMNFLYPNDSTAKAKNKDLLYRERFSSSFDRGPMGYYPDFERHFLQCMLRYTTKLDSMMTRTSTILYNN